MFALSDRIKSIRTDLGLNQEMFGKRIGLAKSSVSGVEKGDQNISDNILRNIINEFSVNEAWLKDGIGEKYDEKAKKEKEFMENELKFMSIEMLAQQQIFFNRLKQFDEDEQLEILTILEEIYSLLNGPGALESDDDTYFEYVETVAGMLCEISRLVNFLKTEEKPAYTVINKYINIFKKDLLSMCEILAPEADLSPLEDASTANKNDFSEILSENESVMINNYRELNEADQEEINAMILFKLARTKTSKRKAKSLASGHGEEAATLIDRNLA